MTPNQQAQLHDAIRQALIDRDDHDIAQAAHRDVVVQSIVDRIERVLLEIAPDLMAEKPKPLPLKHYVVDVLARVVQRTTVYLDARSLEEAEDRALALVRSDIAAWEWEESSYHDIEENDVFEANGAEHGDPADPLPCPRCSGNAYQCATGDDCYHCACGEVVRAPQDLLVRGLKGDIESPEEPYP